MRPYVAEIARIADTNVCIYPNAGLPNEFGEYDQLADEMAVIVGEFAEAGLSIFSAVVAAPRLSILRRLRRQRPKKAHAPFPNLRRSCACRA